MQLTKLDNPRFIPFTHQQMAAMAEAYRRGTPSQKLADAYGISQASVLRRLRLMGVKVRGIGSSREAAKLRGEL